MVFLVFQIWAWHFDFALGTANYVAGCSGLSSGPANGTSIPNLWNLWILLSKAKGWILFHMARDVIKLRILRGDSYPGLSEWNQNAITCMPEWERQRGFWDIYTEEKWWENRAEREIELPQPRNANNHQKAGKNKYSPLQPLEGLWPCWTIDFGFLVPYTIREIVSIVLSHWVVICSRSHAAYLPSQRTS